MNIACSKLKTATLGLRVYGYQDYSDQDLDSCLLFLNNTPLKVCSPFFYIVLALSVEAYLVFKFELYEFTANIAISYNNR